MLDYSMQVNNSQYDAGYIMHAQWMYGAKVIYKWRNYHTNIHYRIFNPRYKILLRRQ